MGHLIVNGDENRGGWGHQRGIQQNRTSESGIEKRREKPAITRHNVRNIEARRRLQAPKMTTGQAKMRNSKVTQGQLQVTPGLQDKKATGHAGVRHQTNAADCK